MYTVKQASEILNITRRAVSMRCKKEGVKKKGRSYMIPKELLLKWKNNDLEEVKEVKEEEAEEASLETITEEFTEEEYNKLQQVIHEYPLLLKRLESQTEEIKYLREEVHNLIGSNKGLIKTLQQSNLLQAKDKGYD